MDVSRPLLMYLQVIREPIDPRSADRELVLPLSPPTIKRPAGTTMLVPLTLRSLRMRRWRIDTWLYAGALGALGLRFRYI